MSIDQAEYTKLVASLQKLSEYLDAVQEKLRVYDTALGFAKLNDPTTASTFEFYMAQTQLEEMKNASSLEHKVLFEQIRGHVARVFQASSSLPIS
jgi:hypothetical protein